MSARRKNLLEAFRSADAPPPAGDPAPERPAPPARAPRPPFELPSLPRWLPWGIGVLVAFAVGFAFGRRSAGEAQAGEGTPGRGASAVPEVSRERPRSTPSSAEKPLGVRSPGQASGQEQPVPATPARIEESALFDPANQYTVVAGTYSEPNSDLAWALHEHLRDEDLPVFQPVVSGDLVLVLVGAAPSSSDLAAVETRVRAVQEEKLDVKPDAYRSRIDALLPRTKNKKGNPR
jgi:hypothetical protein